MSRGGIADEGRAVKAGTKRVLEHTRQKQWSKKGRCDEVNPDTTSLRSEQDLGISTACTAASGEPASEAAIASVQCREEASSQSASAAQTVQSICAASTGLAPPPPPPAAAAAGAEPQAFVLTAASLRARGKQKIPLENAKGLPERLGDMPLRLIVGGNNPSDHAW